MASKYSDIIQIREQKAAYNIQNEEKGEWSVFIANDQFNSILRKVISSVFNNDVDNHKSFWLEGTYGTGKSHAASVIKHLLCDPVDDIREYVNEEYKDPKYAALRQSIFDLRDKIRLFPVTLYGQSNIAYKDDLSLQLQSAVKSALQKAGIDLDVKTDYDNYVQHIQKNNNFWEMLISNNPQLAAVCPDINKLTSELSGGDSGTLSKVKDALRSGGYDIRLKSENLCSWFFEVQDKLAAETEFKGLLVLWDEFTDVMTSDIGPSLLVTLQELNEESMNSKNNSYFFFISHPSALNSLKAEERDKTKGRYHYMKYNMEPISAFKIMSRKFKLQDAEADLYDEVRKPFYDKCGAILESYVRESTNPIETKNDIENLFPIHPATANLATYYAREAGSSSRSVFQFIGENPEVKSFFENEDIFMNKETITADYLWDYVLPEFNDNVTKFGAVTERFNSFKNRVENQGETFFAIFKSILLLNALNNIANNENVTPSEENIKNLYTATSTEYHVDEVLTWLNDQGVIQRAPGGMYSIQFSALPTKEIDDISQQLRATEFKYTSQVINCDNSAKEEFDKYLAQVARPYRYKFFSLDANEPTLLSKIENARDDAKAYELFFALFVAKNADELNELKKIATKYAADERFKYVPFIVFDSFFTDRNYDRYIEYQANAKCAQQHGFADQQQSNNKCASDMIREWIKEIRRGNFTVYLETVAMPNACSKITSVINSVIAPNIFTSGPESLDIIKAKFSKTYWKKALVKDTVNSVLSYNTKDDIKQHCGGAAMHVQFLLQDSVNEDLTFKNDVDPNHPLYKVCQFVDKKIKYADKQNNFNLAEKFIELTRPPFGLYQSYAGMAMFAFAMKPYVNKIFDLQGKPREVQHMVTDVVEVFKSWEEGNISPKVTFRFETPEEGKLCKDFILTFNLTEFKAIEEISSLKNARWVLRNAYVPQKAGYPIWSLKYLGDNVQQELKDLAGNVNSVCQELGSSNPNLLTDVIEGLKMYKFEFRNLINDPDKNNYREGFLAYLKSIEDVNLQDSQFDEAVEYIKSHLQAEIGMWNEEEVKDKLKSWKISTIPAHIQQPIVQPDLYVPPIPKSTPEAEEKKNKADDRINAINNIEVAQNMLRKIADLGYDNILDIIINEGNV